MWRPLQLSKFEAWDFEHSYHHALRQVGERQHKTAKITSLKKIENQINFKDPSPLFPFRN